MKKRANSWLLFVVNRLRSEPDNLSETLLNVLVCPIDKKPLAYIPTFSLLYNVRLKKKYEIKNSIPVLLQEEAINVDIQEHDDLMNKIERYTGS